MEEIILEATLDDIGSRLDKFISDNSELSRSHAAKLCEEKKVKNDKGEALQKKYIIAVGDRIYIEKEENTELVAVGEKMDLDIVYEDSQLIVVNKPQGMVVHPAPGNDHGTLVNGLLYHCKNSLSGINGVLRPGIVHRIDKDTSGLIVVAKTNEAHLFLTEQWSENKPMREYFALIHGNIREDTLTIDKPIGRSNADRKKMAIVAGGRKAITHVKIVKRYKKYTLVSCVLDTGRTHQIRVHLSNTGHPIVGDKTYGVKNEEFNLVGQLLHARTLGFIHPITKNQMVFSSDLPDYFKKVLDILEKRNDSFE